MTGVEAMAEGRRAYQEPSSPSDSSARSSPDTTNMLHPLVASSNSNTSSPPHRLEALTPSTSCSSFMGLTELSSSPSTIRSEPSQMSQDCEETSNWSMHLDVLRYLYK